MVKNPSIAAFQDKSVETDFEISEYLCRQY